MRPLFIFDMDDVLLGYDWRVRMDGLSRITGHSFDELRRRWWNAEGERRAEAGDPADGAGYLAAVNAALGTDLDRETWITNRRSGMTVWPESLAAVERAAELGRVTLLTNNAALMHEELPRVAPELVPLFGLEHLRASSSYGARKPDPVIYERVLEVYGAAPEETFFADDREENIDGAAGLGIRAHLFRDGAGMRAAIEDFARELSAPRS